MRGTYVRYALWALTIFTIWWAIALISALAGSKGLARKEDAP